MYKMSLYTYFAAFITLGIATLLYLGYTVASWRVRVARYALANGGLGQAASGAGGLAELGKFASIFSANTVGFLTLWLIFRTIATGHGPFANMYEFSVSFAWGIMASYVYFEWRYKVRSLGVVAAVFALLLMLYAWTVPADVQPLVPALQNNLLLSIHVAVSIVAYGTFAVAFAAALLFLAQELFGEDGEIDWLPAKALLDEVGYKCIVIGFPMMALVIILGALWADVAWGTYWSWDPKETASLVTWLIYGGYLHARAMRGWRGTRSAVLLLLGFVATLFTYFGNLFFGGLHSYSGLG